MTLERDEHTDMFRFPLDDATADRLLSGRMAPEDAPPGFEHVAALVRTAGGPATSHELAREGAVVASAVAEIMSPATTPTPTRKHSMISKLLTAKVAAAATMAALGLGTAAAAATGSLPGQASSHHSTVHVADQSTTTDDTTTTNDTTTTTGSDLGTASKTTPTVPGTSVPPTGPANQHAQFGLCTAFLAHSSGTTTTTTGGTGGGTTLPPEDNSTAFKALLTEHGGVSGTTTFCQKEVQSKPSDTSASNDSSSTDHSGTSQPSSKSTSHGSTTTHGDSTSHGAPISSGSTTTHGAPTGVTHAGDTQTSGGGGD